MQPNVSQLSLAFEEYGKVLLCRKGQSIYFQEDDADAFYKLDDQGNLVPLDYNKYVKGNKDLFPDD